MSAAQDRLVTVGGWRTSPVLADVDVNAGRKQRGEAAPILAEGSPSAYCERRVIIDVHANGEFTAYSDPDVQVICRCAYTPDDELVQVSYRPIREEWLDMPVGHSGDGSVADLLAEVVADWPQGDPT